MFSSTSVGRKGGLDAFDQARLLGRRVDAIGDAIHAANQLLAALGQDEIDEQACRVRMRRFGGDTGGMDVGENRIQINPIDRRAGRLSSARSVCE